MQPGSDLYVLASTGQEARARFFGSIGSVATHAVLHPSDLVGMQGHLISWIRMVTLMTVVSDPGSVNSLQGIGGSRGQVRCCIKLASSASPVC